MALTVVTKVIYTRGSPLGGVKLVKSTITFDASYTTNGYVVTAAQFGFPNAFLEGPAGTTVGGFVAAWDDTNTKIKCFKVGAAGALTECAANEAGLNADKLVCINWGY